MVYWLWMPIVGLIGTFLLVLCWQFFSNYACCSCSKQSRRETPLPTVDPTIREPVSETEVTPSAPVPHESPVVHLALGTKKISDIVFYENGVQALDLHDMILEEARSATLGFLKRQVTIGTPCFKIITGRGLHSHNQSPILKPVIRNILISQGFQFSETSKGGAFLIHV